MKFDAFAQILAQLELTSSRLEMTHQLAELYSILKASEIQPVSYLLQGQLVASYQTLEFYLSAKSVLKVLQKLDSTQKDITQKYKNLGDIGEVALEVKAASGSKSADLDILAVFTKLKTIAKTSGSGSQQAKQDQLAELLMSVSPLAAKFIARIVVGKLRLGFSTQTMIDALSWVKHGDKTDRDLLEAAFNRRADIGWIAQQYLQNDDFSLSQVFVELGTPVVPALCQRLNSAQEIIDKLSQVVAEPKYDGMRLQVHIDTQTQPNEIWAYTRNLQEVSEMFPELNQIAQHISAQRVILDGEIIGYDPTTGQLLPFQQTSTRRRKHDIADQTVQVPMRLYVFDILLHNDQQLLELPLIERKQKLEAIITESEQLVVTPHLVTSQATQLRDFHNHQLAEGFEGAVIKADTSIYVSGRKGWNWVKIKEAEGTTGKLTDTVDVVVMGYYQGKGKRAQFGVGALLVGVLGAEDTILSISKIGTGMTEAQLQELKQKLDQVAVAKQPHSYQVSKELAPDVWVSPSMVIEVAADELTTSKIHTAGKALRFPRLLQIRTDKDWQQATTVTELASIEIAA